MIYTLFDIYDPQSFYLFFFSDFFKKNPDKRFFPQKFSSVISIEKPNQRNKKKKEKHSKIYWLIIQTTYHSFGFGFASSFCSQINNLFCLIFYEFFLLDVVVVLLCFVIRTLNTQIDFFPQITVDSSFYPVCVYAFAQDHLRLKTAGA